jgi:hypothetical protein
MKKYLFVTVLFVYSLLNAQDMLIDSCSVDPDTICVNEMVLQQVEDAKVKQDSLNKIFASASFINMVKSAEEANQIKKQANNQSTIIGIAIALPVQYQIFIAVSLCIIGFIIVRRIILVFRKRSNKALKERIKVLREEKLIRMENPKLQSSRKKLRGSVIDGAAKNISKIAKDLNIAKGEVLLAARLKFFEAGKI